MVSKSNTPLRAVSYCRTSSEGQRDNTSIPRQKADNERFIKSQEWQFVRHYVDESLTGSKIEGRDDFQHMMRDAANHQFDLIVCWDITRFARDGVDIVNNAKFLKTNFGVHIVDSKGQFDTRDHRHTLTNFVQAGVAEQEKQRILERVIGGRIRRAQQGLPWTPKLPAGRGFNRTSKESGTWFVNEQGEKLKALLTRYADGEPLKALQSEYGFNSVAALSRIIHDSQLSGVYQATFDCPDIGIKDLKVPVPAIPEVITPELEARVRARLLFNRRWNKQGKAKYLLTGFVRCAHCGRGLVSGQNGERWYYRHYTNSDMGSERDCPFCSIRADLLEGRVLDHLYGLFFDKPAYDAAIKAAMPDEDTRKAIEREIKAVGKRAATVDKEIANLVKAIAAGGDLLLEEHDRLKAEKVATAGRLTDLRQALEDMPDPAEIAREATALRHRLRQTHTGKDWRKLPYQEVRRFLHFLFGDNPQKAGTGIYIYAGTDARKQGFWRIVFKGRVEYHDDLIDDRPFRRLVLNRAGNKKPVNDNC
jgi:DNA invertase Pin-like site-specific DNA recombinase